MKRPDDKRRLGALQRAGMLALLALMPACSKDKPPVETTDAALAADGGIKPDAIVIEKVPVEPHDLLLRLPRPPLPCVAAPGAAASSLQTLTGLSDSPFTDAIQVVRPEDGAFRAVLYQLTPDRKTVRAVLMTFRASYQTEARREALLDVMKTRLGKPGRLSSATHSGHVWDAFDYRIELRQERRSSDLELLFHQRPQSER